MADVFDYIARMRAHTPDDQTYLTRREAAEYLRVSVSTIEGWHKRKTGPQYTTNGGKVEYKLSDLISWRNRDRVA